MALFKVLPANGKRTEEIKVANLKAEFVRCMYLEMED